MTESPQATPQPTRSKRVGRCTMILNFRGESLKEFLRTTIFAAKLAFPRLAFIYSEQMWAQLADEVGGPLPLAAYEHARDGGIEASKTRANNYDYYIYGSTFMTLHAVLDQIAKELIGALGIVDRGYWEAKIDGAEPPKISTYREARSDAGLARIRAAFEERVKGAIKKDVDASLPSRVQLLCNRCTPRRGLDTELGFHFSRDELERLDLLRHSIAHDMDRSPRLENFPKDMEFLELTGRWLITMVKEKHNLIEDVLDPSSMLTPWLGGFPIAPEDLNGVL